VSGPHTGERRRLLEMLVSEFPDVFAFPRQHTTRPHDHHARHVAADADELALEAAGSADGSGDRDAAAGAGGPARGSANSSRPGSGASATCTAAPPQQQALCGPQPLVLVREAFEAAAGSGGALVEAHSELFAHSSSAHRFGHSLADLQAVIRAGKLPLLELEAEEAEAVKVTRGVDCLTLFLAPPSLEVHQQRLQDAATESDAEVAERGKAAAELSAVLSNGVFDEVLVNDDADEGYSQLKAAISRLRPDLILPLAAAAAVRAAQHAAASQPAPVVIAGPAGGGCAAAQAWSTVVCVFWGGGVGVCAGLPAAGAALTT
jgi:guanylate kinase